MLADRQLVVEAVIESEPEKVDDDLVEPERLFGEKYANGAFSYDGRHAWLQVVPEKIVSWDLAKMGRA